MAQQVYTKNGIIIILKLIQLNISEMKEQQRMQIYSIPSTRDFGIAPTIGETVTKWLHNSTVSKIDWRILVSPKG